ncbi:MAG: UDP-N-acetylglucosamine 2-epimerase (non-hydrolyzing) [Nitrosarchaeum sp.]|nr:UDP-N-acetylglucosamine 2-epimerase (non-hydrolyzing) [Nitrosarchaeum sp.]
MKRFVIVAGTRPEIIKIAPIIRHMVDNKIEHKFIYTGQHYDYQLSTQIIQDLEIAEPDFSLKLQSKTPASQIAEIMTKLENQVKGKNDIIIVQGDTNSVLATALLAIKLKKKIAHVEAGLRSYDWRMAEEHNRRMVDHVSDFLFAPTKTSYQNLINEKVSGKTFISGNTVMDAIREHLPLADKKSTVMQKIRFSEYALGTLHRAENVDNEVVLNKIIKGIISSKICTVIPLHPRTRKMLKKYNLLDRLKNEKHIQILNPQGYLDFLSLMKNCRFIITDSGGIQEECTSPLLSKRVLVLRTSSERPEAISMKIAELVPLEYQKIKDTIKAEWDKKPVKVKISPYGKGDSAKRIVKTLQK